MPLGRIAGARSGDKGGNANVGVWVRTTDQWRWLAHALTVEQLREMLPETADLEVTRHLLPNLRAVNFVIEGHPRRGRRLPGALRPAGQGPRRMAAQPTHRHTGEPSRHEHLAHARTRAAAKDGARLRRTRGAAATSTSGSGPACCRASCTSRPARRACWAPGCPKSVGGGGGDGADAVIICEEMHYAGAPGGVFASLFTCGIAVPHMIASGDQRLIDTYVRPTLRGEKIGSLAITEPGGGSDVGHLTTKAVRDGDDYIINGAKTYITSGVRADYVVTAVAHGRPWRGRCFADRRRQGHAGFRGHPQARQDGLAVVRHRRAVLHRRPGARRQPDRRGEHRLPPDRRRLRLRTGRPCGAGLCRARSAAWTSPSNGAATARRSESR